MRDDLTVGVIIPVLDEEATIGSVIADLPTWVDRVVVVDNGSRDRSAEVARRHGATVLHQPRRGYGAACLRGMAELSDIDVIAFVDGDRCDHAEELGQLVGPIAADQAEMVVGSRVLGQRESGALTPQARFGNWLACTLMAWIWKQRYTDLGPFRAVRREALDGLDMASLDYGWTVEMQIKAVKAGLRVCEVPASYRRRTAGRSKVSGTVRGVVGAGTKILGTILVEALRGARRW